MSADIPNNTNIVHNKHGEEVGGRRRKQASADNEVTKCGM
jgi:hypothetical protein